PLGSRAIHNRNRNHNRNRIRLLAWRLSITITIMIIDYDNQEEPRPSGWKPDLLRLVEIRVAAAGRRGTGEADTLPDGGVAEVDRRHIEPQLLEERGKAVAEPREQLVNLIGRQLGHVTAVDFLCDRDRRGKS